MDVGESARNFVDEETLSVMKAAGRRNIRIGIKKHGIELETFFMVGFPKRLSRLNVTVEAMKRVECDEKSSALHAIFVERFA